MANKNTPAAFYTQNDYEKCDRFSNVDLSSYFLPEDAKTDITFKSRDGFEGLHGWWFRNLSSTNRKNQTVIVVHGMSACKHRYSILLPTSMLFRNGYDVLSLDVRDAGESPSDNEILDTGCSEYNDVLGAFDFLLSNGMAADQIGFHANSLGTPALLLAVGQETQISTGLWIDSPAYGFKEGAQLVITEMFGGLLPFGIFWHYAKQMTDCDLDEMSAQNGLKNIAKNHQVLPHLMVAAGISDLRNPKEQADELVADGKRLGLQVDTYFTETTGAFSWGSNNFLARKADAVCREHITQMLVDPAAYEARYIAFWNETLKA